jgi:1-acyl-sn-glycerol-3-phosphate acyltransferase
LTGSRVLNFLRSILFVIFLYGSMTLVGVSHAPFVPFKRSIATDAARRWTRMMIWGMRWIAGITVEFRGMQHLSATPVLLAIEHHAMVETLFPFVMRPLPAIVLKRELLSMPIFGWFAAQMNSIALDREAHAAALKALLKASREAVAAGRDIVIFPEGSRVAPGEKGEYKPGVAAMYRDLGIPCVPVAVNSGLFWPAKGLIRKPGHLVVEVLPPIMPGLKREPFMAELEASIETATNALIAEGRGEKSAPTVAPEAAHV